jgi:hypothetical protein
VKLAPAQAIALQPPAFVLATVLVLGGILAPWLVRTRGARVALTGVVATMALFYLTLAWAAPDLQKSGTKTLALYVKTHALPGDQVIHYHNFFHDFTFYAGRTVAVVDGKGELELEEDAAAQTSGRFMDEAAFRLLWALPGRVYAVARQRDVGPLFADPAFHYHLLAEAGDNYLFSNQP